MRFAAEKKKAQAGAGAFNAIVAGALIRHAGRATAAAA